MRSVKTLIPDSIIVRSRALERVNVAIKACAPAPLTDHVVATNYSENLLSVQVTDHIWATNVKYLQIDLLRCLNKNLGLHLTKIKVAVRAPPDQPATPTKLPDPDRKRVIDALRAISRSLDKRP